MKFTDFHKYLDLREKNQLPEREKNFCYSNKIKISFSKFKDDVKYYSSDETVNKPRFQLIY